MVLHFVYRAERDIFDLIKMSESVLFLLGKKRNCNNFCFSVERDKCSRTRQNRDMEVFFHLYKNIATGKVHKYNFYII